MKIIFSLPFLYTSIFTELAKWQPAASMSFQTMLHVVMNDHAFCSFEDLNPEISCPDEICPIVEWNFSTPLRYGRNDSEAE